MHRATTQVDSLEEDLRLEITARSLCRRLSSRGFLLPESTAQEILEGLRSRPLLILEGCPGTGKSALAQLLPEVLRGPASNRTLYHRDIANVGWTITDVIGGLEMIDDRVVPVLGCLTKALVAALENRGQHWLILDELNRADPREVLHPLLNVLGEERQPLKHPHLFLANSHEPVSFPIPASFRIIATNNTVDLSNTLYSLEAAVL